MNVKVKSEETAQRQKHVSKDYWPRFPQPADEVQQH